ncbi:MAG: exosome complex protein Rrp42 [Archaeoglobi archaeon]|nr:exosome complex protein Rrp42 [Candidatus Mnemosynella bozhongmuii]
MNDKIIAEIRKDYIYNLARRGERIDGRRADEYREVKIETDVIQKAEGSAEVMIGNTRVLVGVKMQPGEPFPDTPNMGIIITNAEQVPLASPSFEPGPPDENAIELARVVDRGIRESNAVDLESLCIKEGEEVWMIFIDIHVLDHDGNLIDASALGAIAALMTAEIPNERFGYGENAPLKVQNVPIAVTTVDFGTQIFVDPNLEEEQICSSRMTVIFGSSNEIVGIQKSGAGRLSVEKVYNIVDLSSKKAEELRKKLLGVIENGGQKKEGL